jgi:AraC family transcriptional regulator of adaptative response / DNA-3-methyladenine glycosylase II
MLIDADRCYRALRARDARFDGRLFVGVSSTGIYCRPICTARAPRREHCRFFATAAAAEGQGFRPCLRCRPELAPGNASVDAGRGLAIRAASLVEDGVAGDGRGVTAVAARLGVTDRHLRRTFQAEFGVSPVQFAQTHRLLLAKRLLTDTQLPIVDVALASGFSSLRRFNALFRARYRLAPSDLRKPGPASPPDGFRFWLRFERPFDWFWVQQFLARRAIDGVERVDRTYRRTVRIESRGRTHVGWIDVALASGHDAVEVCAQPALSGVLPQVVAGIKRVFDLACPIREVEAALGGLARAHPGLRVPGAFDGFEAAVRAIIGQQITVGAARTLAGRFVRAFGDPVATGVEGLDRLFPPATCVAGLRPADIAGIGLIATRAHAIVALARAVADGRVALEPGADVQATLDALRALPGIGEWTAQYIALRALQWPDAFPEGDIGIMTALGERSRSKVRARAEAWQPWRAYAVMHLWRSLEDRAGPPPRTAAASRPESQGRRTSETSGPSIHPRQASSRRPGRRSASELEEKGVSR